MLVNYFIKALFKLCDFCVGLCFLQLNLYMECICNVCGWLELWLTLQEKLLSAAAIKVILAAGKGFTGGQCGRHVVTVHVRWVKVLASTSDRRYFLAEALWAPLKAVFYFIFFSWPPVIVKMVVAKNHLQEDGLLRLRKRGLYLGRRSVIVKFKS